MFELAAVFVAALVTEFEFTTTTTFDGRLAIDVLPFASTATLVFALASTLAFVFASVVGVASAGVSATVSKTETPPFKAGIASINADSIKTLAATIVIFDKIVCEPRGWNAVLEILLVKSAPASVLPGWSRTLAISATQDMKNNVYKK